MRLLGNKSFKYSFGKLGVTQHETSARPLTVDSASQAINHTLDNNLIISPKETSVVNVSWLMFLCCSSKRHWRKRPLLMWISHVEPPPGFCFTWLFIKECKRNLQLRSWTPFPEWVTTCIYIYIVIYIPYLYKMVEKKAGRLRGHVLLLTVNEKILKARISTKHDNWSPLTLFCVPFSKSKANWRFLQDFKFFSVFCFTPI